METDLQLLELEIDTLWVSDHQGRLVESRGWEGGSAPYLVIAGCNDGQISAIGSDVPEGIAVELQAAADGGPPSPNPATQPASIAQCEQLLTEAVGPVELSAGPAYVIPADTAFSSAAEIHRSDGDDAEALQSRAPEGAGWSSDEWKLLLNGSFGAWAVATIGGQVIAICHSARLTERGAEAGVWTDEEFRGQGHAAAVTAAWASLLAPSGRHLFYSTSAGNVSSQRVAARLGLRPIGWRWQLSPPRTA